MVKSLKNVFKFTAAVAKDLFLLQINKFFKAEKAIKLKMMKKILSLLYKNDKFSIKSIKFS